MAIWSANIVGHFQCLRSLERFASRAWQLSFKRRFAPASLQFLRRNTAHRFLHKTRLAFAVLFLFDYGWHNPGYYHTTPRQRLSALCFYKILDGALRHCYCNVVRRLRAPFSPYFQRYWHRAHRYAGLFGYFMDNEHLIGRKFWLYHAKTTRCLYFRPHGRTLYFGKRGCRHGFIFYFLVDF